MSIHQSPHRPLRWLVFIFLTIAAVWFSANHSQAVQAAPRRNIVLLYFTATGQNNAVLLEWATASEFETAGFQIERALNPNGPFTILSNIPFIPAEGDGIIGAEYEATDTAVSNGTTYYYNLIEVEYNGDENREGPVSATPGGGASSTATFTPSPTSSATPSVTPAPTDPASTINTPGPGGQEPTATSAPTQPAPTQSIPPTLEPSPATATTSPLATAPPTFAPPASGETNSGSDTPPQPTTVSTNSLAGSEPVATDASHQAISQVDPTATGPSGYPGQPATPTPEAGAAEATAYPGSQPTPVINAPATAYPGGVPLNGEPVNGTGNPAVIGGENGPAATEAASTTSQPAESSGDLFLWVAFLASLLIFVAGVLGSIFLFNRQRVRGG